MILSFQTDRSWQTVQTQISWSNLIRVYTVCNFGCIVWVHYSSVKPSCSNFRMTTANFLGVRIFRIFTVPCGKTTLFEFYDNHNTNIGRPIFFNGSLDTIFNVSVYCRYFYKEIKSYLEGAKVISIFEETAKQGIFKLKDYISLHLYLSQPPVGDYRECLGM